MIKAFIQRQRLRGAVEEYCYKFEKFPEMHLWWNVFRRRTSYYKNVFFPKIHGQPDSKKNFLGYKFVDPGG